MRVVHHLGLCDYIVIVLSLMLSLGIGIRFHFTGGKQKTSRDFMLAGSNMPRLPVILSIVVTHISAILMLGAPAEIYRYGSQLMTLTLGMAIGIVLASYLILPIYFNLGICTVYEYLEMRYGRFTRIVVSGLFVLQMLLYMSVVLYAPALALSAVTDLSTETSILLMGLVCIIYCALGGLKAVLWTDAFQSALMYTCVLIIFISGILEVGPYEIIYRSKEGKRWEFFNFNVDLTTRYTVWNALFRGLSFGIGGYGFSQLEIQRLLSLNVIKKAQSALLYSLIPITIVVLMCYSLGLILYGVFYGCDPILNREQTGLSKHDQLVPYYIITRLSHIPGVTGLCIAGLFSGSLSTISSAVNSISTVTVVDFIQPYCSCLNLKDKQTVWIAKCLVILYGLLCIGLTFLFYNVGSISQMATVALGIMEGPVTAIFLLGILTVKANQKGSAVGFVAGCLFSGWIGYGSSLSGYVYPTLPISAENCSSIANSTLTESESITIFKYSWRNITDNQTSSNIFLLYRISYMWIPTLGFICTVCIGYAASTVIGWNKKRKIDANYLSPVVRKWMVNSAFEDVDKISLEESNTITTPNMTIQSIKQNTITSCKL